MRSLLHARIGGDVAVQTCSRPPDQLSYFTVGDFAHSVDTPDQAVSQIAPA
jgi:hypothetical protein